MIYWLSIWPTQTARMQACPFCDLNPAAIPHLLSFRKCPRHKILINTTYRVLSYEEDYFGAEYKTQYGKDYLSDRESLMKRNSERISQTKEYFSSQSHKKVLEVGSAAGFFLELMQQKGYDVTGYEISRKMATYAAERGIKTIQGSFMNLPAEHPELLKAPFDIVAAFYVLEHFAEQKTAWKILSNLTRTGGYLLLTLPSYSGPVYMFNKDHWAKTHPPDHAVDYSPEALKVVANEFGFKLKKVKSEGIHPSRFPLGKYFPFNLIYSTFQKNSACSDTIFAILEKQ